MPVPGLFLRSPLGPFVLLQLLAALLLLVFLLPVAIDHLVDGLAVAAGLDPALAGLFVLRLIAGDQDFLLLNRLAKTAEEGAVVAYPGRLEAVSAAGSEVTRVLFPITPQLFQLGFLGVQELLTFAELAHGVLFPAVGDALHRLHAFGSCHWLHFCYSLLVVFRHLSSRH